VNMSAVRRKNRLVPQVAPRYGKRDVHQRDGQGQQWNSNAIKVTDFTLHMAP